MTGEDKVQYFRAINRVFFGLDKGRRLKALLTICGLKRGGCGGALLQFVPR
jgi:hypothetical protein